VTSIITWNHAKPRTPRPQLTKIYCAHLNWQTPVWVLVSVPNGASDNTISNEANFLVSISNFQHETLEIPFSCDTSTNIDSTMLCHYPWSTIVPELRKIDNCKQSNDSHHNRSSHCGKRTGWQHATNPLPSAHFWTNWMWWHSKIWFCAALTSQSSLQPHAPTLTNSNMYFTCCSVPHDNNNNTLIIEVNFYLIRV